MRDDDIAALKDSEKNGCEGLLNMIVSDTSMEAVTHELNKQIQEVSKLASIYIYMRDHNKIYM